MTHASRAAQGTHYVVGPLDPDAVERAFALVRPATTHVDMVRWRALCARRDPAGRDLRLLAARDPSGTVRGLGGAFGLVHRVHGPILACPLFLVASPLDPLGVAEALVGALLAAARRQARLGVLVNLRLLDPSVSTLLSARGQREDGTSVFLAARRADRPPR